MPKIPIYNFYTQGPHRMPVLVSIEDLPQNCTARIHTTLDFNCGVWFILYSVYSNDSRHTEYFYELVEDTNETADYDLIIVYDSTRAICSFKSNEQITFVDSGNNVLVEQLPIFHEYEYSEKDKRTDREYKMFLVIYKNKLVIFWNDNLAKVTVKTFDLLSLSFDIPRDYHDFTRVDFNFELTHESCKITFCTDSPGNRYFSAYIVIEPFSSNDVSVVLKDHRFNQMSCSPFNGSQFEPDTCDEIGNFTFNLTHYVDGELQEDDSGVESDTGSEEESDADSEDDY